jgi:hypothetical protein
MTRFRTTDARR